MQFVPGKPCIDTATGKIPLMAVTGFNTAKKIATLKVTCKVVGGEAFDKMREEAPNDIELLKELITDIAPGDKDTKMDDYTPDMLDELYKEAWQWNPVLEFVVSVNDVRVLKEMARKN